jgi:hypothetical protein
MIGLGYPPPPASHIFTQNDLAPGRRFLMLIKPVQTCDEILYGLFCHVQYKRGKGLLLACAVLRRRFSVGANPTRRCCSSRKQSEQSWR